MRARPLVRICKKPAREVMRLPGGAPELIGMSTKLRELIRQVRASKTAADERAVIAKECAAIRTALRDEESPFRHRNLAKLLYISMLGYATSFGQMECLKLIASGNFPEKRVGYLGLSVILDENQEVLMLITNTLKRDLGSENPYIVGLALSAFGNVASSEMSRDLASEIERQMSHHNSYIKKKAILCAVRAVRKAPETTDDFLPAIPALLQDKNHGVLLGTFSLATEMLMAEPDNEETAEQLAAVVPVVLRLLKSLLASNFAPEYDVQGITDPMLQVRILRFLRHLGSRFHDAEEELEWLDDTNDLLAQVATNTDGAKNPGNAILYECVQTIMSIRPEQGLREMAINILGRFLQNKDNNIRYVALNSLCKTGKEDSRAIQKHRNTIVDCLKDPDVSIRRRALDLIYALVNKANVEALVKELVAFLLASSGDPEFRADLTDKVCVVINRFAPSPLWQLETMVRVLEAAGDKTKDNVLASLIILISQHPDLHAYAAHRLFRALDQQDAHAAFLRVALWTVGEYGGHICSSSGTAEANHTAEGCDVAATFDEQEERVVVDRVQHVLERSRGQGRLAQLSVMALAKLTSRFRQEEVLLRIDEVLEAYEDAHDVEVQSRACEFRALLGNDFDSLRAEVLASVPALDPSVVSRRKEEIEDADEVEMGSEGDDALLDLDAIVDETPREETTKQAPKQDDLLDLLFTDTSSVALSTPVQQKRPSAVGFTNEDLQITFYFEKKGKDAVSVEMHSENLSSSMYAGYQILIAVPKYMKQKLYAPSHTTLNPGKDHTVTQKVDLINAQHESKPYAIRLKIDYSIKGKQVTHQAQFASFPALE